MRRLQAMIALSQRETEFDLHPRRYGFELVGPDTNTTGPDIDAPRWYGLRARRRLQAVLRRLLHIGKLYAES